MYPNENYQFIMAPCKKKLDYIHGRSTSCFKDKLWFQTKWRLQMPFSRNQRINIMYPNANYSFVLAPHDKKLDSIYGRSSSRFKDNLWLKTIWRLRMIFSWNQCFSTMYPKENYTFVLVPHEKELDSIHGQSLSGFKDKLWFQTKRRLPMLFLRNKCINIVYTNET